MVPPPSSRPRGLFVRDGIHRRRELKPGKSGVWTQEVRKRVFFNRRWGGAECWRGCRRPDSGAGGSVLQQRCQQKDDDGGGEEESVSWIPSQAYALSVYETSSILFCLNQVGANVHFFGVYELQPHRSMLL